MTDIAEITRRTHEYGFEQGSFITLQAVMSWLDAHGGSAFAAGISAASHDGTLERYRPGRVYPEGIPVASVIIDPIKPTDIGPVKLSREQATQSGYTGDSCIRCGSMRMQVAGHCTVCADCGETTGCS